MSVENSVFSRLFRWFVPTGTEGDNPAPLEKASESDLQSAGSPNNDGAPSENQRQEDRDHEREVLLMLHICC